MWLVCRSIAGGSVVMLPNVLPVLVVFGGMGWLGIAVDIGSMMSASIALGVAVDDTIHFLTWYREDLKKLGDRKAAIVAAYGRSGPPTLQAALISGLSLSVFAFSTFTPTQRLGWLMMTILVCGVIAELVMMPAILAGPLGKAFPVRRPPTPAHVPVPHAPKRRAALVTSQT
jgi:predicted RND superfamily exporter protein